MANTNDSTFTCRADKELIEAFKKTAKDNNRTASQLVRDYMLAYVKKNGQGKLDLEWVIFVGITEHSLF